MDDDERRSAMDVLRGSRILAYSIGGMTLAAGLVLLFWPDRTILVVARIAGLLIGIVGLSECFEAITTHRKGSYWGLLLLRGLMNVVAGALLLFWPDITVTVIVWLLGLDLLLTGGIGLFVSRRIPDDLGRSSVVTRSIVSILFGVAIMAWPDATISVVAFIIAAQLILFGGLLLFSGYQLTKVSPDDLI
jgi:uncharacterized membrane protein HdeD (DUF308 family)